MADDEQLTQQRERFFKASMKFAAYFAAHVAVILLLMLIFLV